MLRNRNRFLAMCSLFSDNDNRCNGTVKPIASDYLSSGMVIKQGASPQTNLIEMKDICGFLFPVMSDKNTFTCVPAVQGHKQLQAIFITPFLVPTDELSVEVILMNVDDCSSPAWTWFVESEYQPGIFTECSSNHVNRVAEFTLCTVTCKCAASCDFLYLKHNRIPRRNQTSEQLCEIWTHQKRNN